MNRKERLSTAKITHDTVAEKCGLTRIYIGMVLNGTRNNKEVLNAADELLKEAMEKDKTLKPIFKIKGI